MLEEDVGFICKRVSERMQRYSSRDLQAHGLTLVQFHVLDYLLQSGDGTSQRELEQYLEIHHSAVSGIVSRLEDKGFIRCACDPADKRQKLLYVTEKGREIYALLLQAKDRLNGRIIADLSPDEVAHLKLLLEKVYRNLE